MYERQKGPCAVSWCDRDAKTKGYCKTCYTRWQKGRDPEKIPMFKIHRDATPEERLQSAGWTVTETGCWEWAGRLDKKGYGVLALREKRQVFAHRTAYSVWVGDLVDGLSICHRCDNPKCINPEHLWQGSTLENLQDMTVKERGNTRKLTAADVVEIRERRENRESMNDLAKEFGVHESTIRNAVKGRTWKHV